MREIGSRLAQAGNEVTVYTKGSFGRTRFSGVDYVGIPAGGEDYSSGSLKTITALALSATSDWRRYDVVQGHGSFPILGIPSMLSGPPGLLTLYSPLSDESLKDVASGPLDSLSLKLSKSRSIANLVSSRVHFVCISSKVKRSLGRPLRGATVIPVGVDYNRFVRKLDTGPLARELQIKEEKRVLFAGDVTPWKGGDDFLVAAKLIAKEVPSVAFLFLTKGIYEHETARMAHLRRLVSILGLEGRVKFLGQRPDIESVYQFSDAVVMPYRSIYSMMSTPLSLLEVLASGRPLVATRVGDIPEILTHGRNGLLVSPRDTQAIAHSVVRILTDSGLSSALGSAARLSAQSRDWSAVVKAYGELYRRLV